MTEKPTYEELEQKVKDLEKAEYDRKQAEQALREREADLSRSQKAAHLGSWEWDVITGSQIWADELFRIIGYEPQAVEASLETLLKCVHPDDRDYVENLTREFLDGNQSDKTFEYRIVWPGGTERFTQCSFYSAMYKEGKPVKVWGILLDITGRKQAEEALNKSEERMKLFMASSTEAFFLLDSELNLTMINKVGLDFSPGTKEADVIGKHILDISPHLEDTGRYKQYQKVIETGKPLLIENIVPHPKFGNIHMSLRAFKVGDGLGMIIKDITNRIQAEKALRESEEKFRNLAEMLPVAVFETDHKLKVGYANTRALEMFSYNQDDIEKGLSGFNVFIPEEKSLITENLDRRIKGEETGLVELRAQRKDGSTFPTLLHTNPIVKDGEFIGLRGIAIDITERKRAEEALQESEEKFRSVVTNLRAVIFILNNEGTVELSEGRTLNAFGFKPGQVDGQSVLELFKDYPDILKLTKRALKGETINTIVQVGEVALEVFYNPLKDKAGNVYQIIWVGTEITETNKQKTYVD